MRFLQAERRTITQSNAIQWTLWRQVSHADGQGPGLPPETKNRHPHFSAQNVDFIHVAKYNDKFPKNRWKLFFFFSKWFPKASTIIHDFSIEITESRFFFHVGYKNWRLVFFRNSGKLKIHVFSLTPISNFHGFSIEIAENHVFSTFCGKIHVSGNPDKDKNLNEDHQVWVTQLNQTFNRIKVNLKLLKGGFCQWWIDCVPMSIKWS